MGNNLKKSRRSFLRNTSLLGAVIPFSGFAKFMPDGGTFYENMQGPGEGNYSIAITGNQVKISAGYISRMLDLNNDQIITKSLNIGGNELLSGASSGFSIAFYKASPNKRPAGIKLQDDNVMQWADGSAVNEGGTNQPVSWEEQTVLNGRNLGSRFKLVDSGIETPRKGVTRLRLRAYSLTPGVLKDVSLTVFYEIYEGYPAIRKWIEIANNSAQWLKIDRFVIDDIQLAPAFSITTPLTPQEQGAESSIIAFGNPERSCGIIASSEIPSALRTIAKNGAMGYTNEYFEWVLGPSENFISEPVFHYGFFGDNNKTSSAISTVLDRAVETPFKEFLRNCIGLRADASLVSAPVWCSYTNFVTDLTDANMRRQADIAADMGFSIFQLDEGWAATPSPGGSEPGPTFPDFEETCKYILSKGLRLGLWISCFRGTGSKDIAVIPDGRSLPLFKNTKRGYGMSFSGPWRDYFANDLVYMHDKYGMSYVKMDLTNISKGDIADSHESRTKKESVLRGLRGLLHVNKRVADIAPDLWTQVTHEIYWRTPGPPADIAVLKYACAFHTTPNTYLGAGNAGKPFSPEWNFDPEKMRADLIRSCWQARQRYFSHRGLPLYSIEFYAANAVSVKGSLTPQVQDRQICSWLMGAPTVFAGDLSSLTGEHIRHYRQRFDLLKRLQKQYNIYRYFQYSGVPAPTDTDWHWWGKLNDEGHGVVVVIRGKEGNDEKAVNIPWVNGTKKYLITALFTGKKFGVFSGKQLMSGQLKLSLPVYGQEILELASAG